MQAELLEAAEAEANKTEVLLPKPKPQIDTPVEVHSDQHIDEQAWNELDDPAEIEVLEPLEETDLNTNGR